jgi:hypothetical protein
LLTDISKVSFLGFISGGLSHLPSTLGTTYNREEGISILYIRFL